MKRPLCTAAAAWMLGELFAEDMRSLSAVLAILFFVVLAGRMVEKKKDLFFAELAVITVFLFTGAGAVTCLEKKYVAYDSVEEGEIVQAEGRVKSVTASSYGYKVILTADKVKLSDTGRKMPTGVNLLAEFEERPDVKTGNRIWIKGAKIAFHIGRNEGNFDEKEYCRGQKTAAKLKGTEYAVTDKRYSEIREKLAEIRRLLCENIDSACREEEASVLKAILYGEKTGLNEDQKELYVKSGIAHILAISGLHMSIVGMGVYRLLRKKYNFFNAGIISGGIIIAFGIMTGFGISVKRAVYMMVLRIAADISGRKYDFKSAVSFSLLLVLMKNPYAIYSTSFLLSYSAMLSLGFIYPGFEAWFEVCKRKKKKKYLRYCMAVLSGALMWLVNLPVIAYFYFEIPTYSILLNFIVLPMMSVLFLSGMAASFAMFLSFPIGIFVSGAASSIVKLYTFLCSQIEKFPFARVVTGRPDSAEIILFYGIMAALLVVMKYYKKGCFRKILLTVIFFAVQISIIYRKPSGHSVNISVIDVGQGDCILVENRNGHTYLVDAGSSTIKNVAEYNVVPYLKCKGIGSLDYVMVSHGDSDHINGILQMMEKDDLRIRNLVLPDCGQFSQEYGELRELAKRRDIPVIYVSKGDSLKDGEIRFEIISPEDKKYGDINDASMVMRMEYQEFSMYFTGDISEKTERELLQAISAADVLRVPHHGSGLSSSQELLEKANPSVAMISCGVGNRYGHPHRETVERYEMLKTELFVTAESGCIEIEVPDEKKGKEYYVSTFLQN